MGYKDPAVRREKHRLYMAKRLASDPEFKAKHLSLVREQSRRRRNAYRSFIDGYKSEHPCVDCGESDPVVLDFDHVLGKKKFNIGSAASGKTIAEIVAEIEKCEVRCANCHRRATHLRRSGKN